MRDRIEWARQQHQYAAGYTGERQPPPNYGTTVEGYRAWHQACADWYAKMVSDLDARTSASLDVLGEVALERSAQDAKWGEQNHPAEVWLAILTEEVGEMATELLRWRFDDPEKRYNRSLETGIPLEPRDDPIVAAREEAIQVAAVAVAFVEAIDRARLSEQPGGER